MGMFDYVKYSAPCFKCGEIITEWQSKDHDCTLAVIDVAKVQGFYGDCKKCGEWNEYKVEVKEREITEKRLVVEVTRIDETD